jgi:hypothetical protein
MDWDLRPDEKIRRIELIRRFGGSRQGGICPSRRTPNILVFTDPSEGEQYGYFDGWRDKLFHYTGAGQKGDQQMSRGNAAILQHREKGRALRLFYGARGEIRYGGQFEVDSARPFYRATAPERGSSAIRKVIIFRLRRVDSPASSEHVKSGAETVSEVPIEAKTAETALVHPRSEVYAARRLEQQLVHAYRDYAQKRGSAVVRHCVRPEGEANPLFTDAYDKTRNNLIEAKGSVAREMIRMAIGQLADYSRFFHPRPRLAVLLPTHPRNDLEALLNSQGISAIWQSDNGTFEDNAAGAFT